MAEKRLYEIIESINNNLKGVKKILLYNEHGKYNLKLKCNNKYNKYKDLIPNASEEQIYWFLSGISQTLNIINKK